MALPPPRVCRGDGNLFIMPLVQPRSDARTQVHQTRPFQRPDRSLKADWLDERPTSNGAVWERVEPARLGGRWFGADGPPSPPPSPRDLQCCLKVRQVRHRAPPRYTKCACRRTLTDHRSLFRERATRQVLRCRKRVEMMPSTGNEQALRCRNKIGFPHRDSNPGLSGESRIS